MRASTSLPPAASAAEGALALDFCCDLDFDLAMGRAFGNCAAHRTVSIRVESELNLTFCLRMIFSENRFPLFGIILYRPGIAPASGPTRKRPKMAGFEGSCGVAIGATAAIVRAKLPLMPGRGRLPGVLLKTTQGMLRCSFRRRLPKGRCSAGGQAAIAAT